MQKQGMEATEWSNLACALRKIPRITNVAAQSAVDQTFLRRQVPHGRRTIEMRSKPVRAPRLSLAMTADAGLPTANGPRRRTRLLSIFGVLLAFGVPAVALVESNVRGDLSLLHGALLVAITPWLILVWVVFAERRPLTSIGLRRIDWVTVGFGLIGIVVNVAISITIGALSTRLGIHEPEFDFVARMVRQGYGWVIVVIVTSGAAMTEIAWRGYALERLRELAGGRCAVAATIQIVVTTALFLLSRPAHTLVWVVDDAVFTAFYFWRRNTAACLAAHAVPNFIASTLVALGLAR